MPSLTAEKVAGYLPLSGKMPQISGRIINVTHQIPYHISRSGPSILEQQKQAQQQAQQQAQRMAGRRESIADNVDAAPISKVARHHVRGRTLRAKFRAAEWTIVQNRGHGALNSGLQSLSEEYQTLHIGWTGPIKDETNKKLIPNEELTEDDKSKIEDLLMQNGNILPVFLDSKARGHYEGYCKEVLWPLFHYLVWTNDADGRSEKQYWEDYVAVNRQFAEIIAAKYRPGDIIFINDYHLLLVPEMLREKIHDAPIGLFLHATFPSSEIFRCLTTRKEILHGFLGANLVGFQTYSYARHFIGSCTRVLGCESTQTGVNVNGHIVSVGTFPIGVDAKRVDQFRREPAVPLKMKAIRDMYADKKIIIGRDKLDSTKGVLQKLHAFEKFLKDYPEFREQVVLVQVTTPTYGDNSKLETKVTELVSHINGVYGNLQHQPVHHYYQDVDRDEYYALLSVADVGLITSLRDGMNTTSLEYIICQQETHGPLILSEFTGTAGSLSAAMIVNPFDYAGVAKAIYDALTMSPEDKLTRHKQLFNYVLEHSASYWAKSFVKQLVESTKNFSLQSQTTPALDPAAFIQSYKTSKKRVMFFDYDGTLTPIVSVPTDAKPSKEMLQYLQTLCDDPRNEVWVISGRDQACLEDWLGGITNLGLSGEHGCFLKPAGSNQWTNVLEDIDMSWKKDVTEIFDYYTERTEGSFVEHKKSSITWHYRMADEEYGLFQAKECQNHLENTIVSKMPVEILVGKKNLEVRPMMINKGEVVKRILSLSPQPDFIVCAGDDKTDEDMFRTLSATYFAKYQDQVNEGNTSTTWDDTKSNLYSITVGPAKKKSMANWQVEAPAQIIELLGKMVEADKS
ncbi:glycosyltransferase family 20-domain-containing protein [Gilbertella persicaria]|uniref:glycosyltransferase family 20-domain-containing protein n=1 Tax=Gilbertella persicaria TaxID=101096 RepID=UPI00221F359A|nr:glycosyltransferase family 20-domain-containing protein [Gilbertella persicaria]KAI8091282.1 glycosyltransferase family 20-domain-containing protein [Gilbertella persicaria]